MLHVVQLKRRPAALQACDFCCQSFFYEYVKNPIYGRETDCAIHFFDLQIDMFCGLRGFRACKYVEG